MRNTYLLVLIIMLKTVVLLDISVENVIHVFQDSLMNKTNNLK